MQVYACEVPFEGFGIHLGSIDHFAASPPGTVQKVVDNIYNDLAIRRYRTSIESTFSPRANVYEIVCGSVPRICSWIEVLETISEYPDKSVMASIWSPPSRMKTILNTLPTSQERNFYYFITNVTKLIKKQFGIEIERVSPVNEPENIFAPWEHLNMLPQQLCRIVRDFNDSTISLCPENSYFTTTLIYANSSIPACIDTCSVVATHAYQLVLGENNNLMAHYDLTARDRIIPNHVPIWQTEVCTTSQNPVENQMQHALDLAVNIVNFVGHTCVQRYYFWLSYTLNPSGESLIWGDLDGNLTLSKTYFAYKHFTLAAFDGSKMINKLDSITGVSYLTFEESKAVFVNNLNSTQTVNWTKDDTSYVCNELICTTDLYDWNLSPDSDTVVLPPESVCSCTLIEL